MLMPRVSHLFLLTAGFIVSNGDSTAAVTSATVASINSEQSTASSSSLVSTVGSTASNATCRSRTINYITHTLPQQCLRVNRTSLYGTNPTISSSISTPLPSQEAVATNIAANAPSSEAITEQKGVDSSLSSTMYLEVDTNSSTSSVSYQESPSATSTHDAESETDSPLDNANFLSFEEWKKQNLAKAGQNPDQVGQPHIQVGERKRPGINNALDALGEEAEIELDFSGFVGGAFSSQSLSGHASPSSTDEQVDGPVATSIHRPKDAGKTCKERTNYASFDCAATVLKSNPECTSASSVLVENKDTYMLNMCSATNKFFIIELCTQIYIDTVVLANYEFFSSIFRHFRVSVSDRYPVKMEKWKVLGTFEARNTRQVQAFLVEHPQIWARYLRIEFLSHYGNEYYCPLSLLRVHGTTMMEQFRREEEMARGEVNDVDEMEIESDVTAAAIPVEPVGTPEESGKSAVVAREGGSPEDFSSSPESTTGIADKASEPAKANSKQEDETSPNNVSRSVDIFANLTISRPSDMMCTPSSTASSTDGAPSGSQSQSLSTIVESVETVNGSTATTALPPPSSRETETASPLSSNSSIVTSDPHESKSSNSTVANSATSVNSTRTSTSTAAAQIPQPSNQESFYNSIHRRLKQLESNSTLSLQYIEEQSRILRDAFGKVEKRQLAATTSFLVTLNTTVMTELQGFRQAYDQLWQSTVIELEGQREHYQREMLALSSRLSFVADELVWQKRMGIVQSTLLLLCLGMVLFARAGNGQLELPLMHQMLQRSQAAALKYSKYDSEPGSPSPTSRSPVSLFRRKLWRRSGTDSPRSHFSDADSSRPQSKAENQPDLNFEAPTPPSPHSPSDSDSDSDDNEGELQVRSSPATPSGMREALQRPPSWPGPGEGGGIPQKAD